MARSGVRVDEVIDAPGLPVGEVHDRLLAAMAAEGDYQAVQVGSDRFQFARTFRPTWAIVTACITVWLVLIGIVFLLVKTTETCLAVIESDHRGTRLRLQGRISSTALGRVRAAMAGAPGADAHQDSRAPRPLPGSALNTGSNPAVGTPVASTYPAVEQAGPPPSPPMPSPEQASLVQPPAAQPSPFPPPAQASQAPAAQAPEARAAAQPPPYLPPQPLPSDPVPGHGASGGQIAGPVPEQRSTLTPDQMDDVSRPVTNDADVVIPAPPPGSPGRAERAAAAEASTPSFDTPASAAPGGRPDAQPAGYVGPHALLDDGTAVTLDALTLIGRDPASSEGEEAKLVALEDSTMSVSKTHLAVIRTDTGWTVCDRNSTNGVSIVAADGSEAALNAGVPTSVEDGAVVRFGDRTLRLVISERPVAGASGAARVSVEGSS